MGRRHGRLSHPRAGDGPRRGSFDLWMDQIVVQVGRGLSSLQFQSPNSPFEVFEVDSYAMPAAERLTEALG